MIEENFSKSLQSLNCKRFLWLYCLFCCSWQPSIIIKIENFFSFFLSCRTIQTYFILFFVRYAKYSSLMYRKAITTIDDSEENISTKMNGTKEIWIFIDIQRECLILFNWLQFTVFELIFFFHLRISLENFQIISSFLLIDFIHYKLDQSIIFNTQKQVEVKSQIWKSNHQPWFREKTF